MKALVFDGELRLDPDYPDPAPRPGWAVIRVRQAGICRTDLEITRGYMSFRGVLGHEFVGTVSACSDADRVGQRVVGEINAACGACDWCRRGMGRHCPRRTTLGILNLDGCMAEYCALPVANLHAVPPEIPDDRAVFVEPLSAACEILDQVQVESGMRCVVVGDGKLGILCAWVLATVSSDVTLVGHHREHLEAAEWGGVKTTVGTGGLTPGADVVVEASGSENGLMESIGLCRPRGTLVLKSTVATQGSVNLAPIVVNELTVVGSRCGRFERGLEIMESDHLPVEQLIAARYPLADGIKGFEHASRRGALKVLITVSS